MSPGGGGGNDGDEDGAALGWDKQQQQAAPTAPTGAAEACAAPVLTRQELRALGIVQGEDGRLHVQRTERSSSKGKQAAMAAAAAAAAAGGGPDLSSGLGRDPRVILQALGALIRVGQELLGGGSKADSINGVD